jgi:exodeoxyribonuclease VII large subunit
MASATTAVSVSEYAARIQRMARSTGAAMVEGEVQKPRKTSGGALMFDLTDGSARLPCKALPWTLRAGIGHVPRGGELVRVTVAGADFWPAGGVLTVVVQEIELAGDGELLRRREELLERLQREGLCDAHRFPPLPRFPLCVGLIAGPGSDALVDVLRSLAERFPCARVLTACCPVQGARAPAAIIDRLALLDCDPRVEVIVLARGGGSVQDLVAFDDERLCRAVRAIDTPVVAAIGHTSNRPVLYGITHHADVPRQAAEVVVAASRREVLRDVADAAAAIERTTQEQRRRAHELALHGAALRGRDRLASLARALAERAAVLDGRASDFRAGCEARLAAARERFAACAPALRAEVADSGALLSSHARAVQRARAQPAHKRAQLTELGDGLARAGGRALRDRRRDLEGRAGVLGASDPRRRGWILARDASGRLVRTVTQLGLAESLELRLADGTASATITDIKEAQA